MSSKFETVTKLDVARRQLKVAVHLFFARGDSIAIHTLACAVHEVLFPILKNKNAAAASKVFLNPANPRIRPEYKREWSDKVKAAQNFFKHGSRDSSKDFKFNPELTQFHIFDATLMLGILSRAHLHEAVVFQAWFYLKYPNILLEGKLRYDAESLRDSGFDTENYETMLMLLKLSWLPRPA